VAESLAARLGTDHLDAALVTDDPVVLDALELSAVTLPVPGRPEDLGAEQPIPLRLEGAVVDGLRFLHFAVGPTANLLGRGQADPDGPKAGRIDGLLVEEPEELLHRQLL